MSEHDNQRETSVSDTLRPLMHVGTQEANDPSVYEEISRPWDLLATPLDRGVFGYRRRYLITPSVTIYIESFDTLVRVKGLTPPGKFGFSIPFRLGGKSSYWNAAPSDNGIPASLPGALDAHIDARQSHLIILLDISLVHRELSSQRAAALLRAAAERHIPTSPRAIEELGCWLSQLLDHAHRHPDMLQHPSQLRTLEEDLLHRLGRLLDMPTESVERTHVSIRRQGFNRAVELMRKSDISTLSISQLCRASCVSQRTLEYAFRENFDITPTGFIRLHRFHAARRALLMALHDQTTVAEVAHKSGFYELGRFASNYNSIFHELPSQTLAADPVETEGAVDLNWRRASFPED